MNIGFDAKRAFVNKSGLGNYSRSTIEILSRFYPGNKYFLFTDKDANNLIQPHDNQFIIQPNSGFYHAIPALWRSWGIYHQLNDNKLDIYHGLSNELPFSIKKDKAKSVVTIHDLIFLRYPEYYPAIDRQIYLYKFRHACSAADTIIATSEATKSDIISFFGTDPAKIEVVYQTCNPVFSVPVSKGKKSEIKQKYDLPDQFILYLGTIEKRKNALTLIKAYLGQKVEIPLLIAGKSTQYLTEIMDFLKQNHGGKKIIFRHDIESVDLPALYQSALVFVYPSVFEGFGIPILEALCSGVPVITSRGSCFSETGGNAALYCDPTNPEEMGSCIAKVLSDSTYRDSMTEKGFLHAKKFNEANVAANLMKVYSALIEKKQ